MARVLATAGCRRSKAASPRTRRCRSPAGAHDRGSTRAAATSAFRAFRGGLPASPNQATRTQSPSSSQVPATTPPATTTGAIQPLCLLTAARRAGGTTRAVSGSRAEHVLVEARQQPHGASSARSPPARRGPRPGRSARSPVHVDLGRAGRPARRTSVRSCRLPNQPAGEPVAEGVGRSPARRRRGRRRSRRAPPPPDPGRRPSASWRPPGA